MAHLDGTSTTNGDYDEKEEGPITFEFPIKYYVQANHMKNIPPFPVPNFCGTSSEDPNAFLFKFDVLCRSNDYSSNSQKLKLFPTH